MEYACGLTSRFNLAAERTYIVNRVHWEVHSFVTSPCVSTILCVGNSSARIIVEGWPYLADEYKHKAINRAIALLPTHGSIFGCL